MARYERPVLGRPMGQLRRALAALCSTRFALHVPPERDDPDVSLSDALDELEALRARVAALEGERDAACDALNEWGVTYGAARGDLLGMVREARREFEQRSRALSERLMPYESDRLAARVAALEGALGRYADPANWATPDPADTNLGTQAAGSGGRCADVWLPTCHGPEVARAALAGEGGG